MVIGYETKTVIEEGSPTLVSDGPMDSAWPMFGHDAHHTGRSPYSTAGNTGVEIWRFTAEGMITGGPVIGDDGTIYFGDWADYFYALYPDGTFKWKYRMGGTISSTPAIGDDGTVYIGSWDHKLYAFKPNGFLKWKFNAGSNIASSPTIAEDGTIYIGASGKKLCAVNPNGTEKWHYDIVGSIFSSPAIGEDGTVYIGTHSGYFYALHANGTLRWEKSLGTIRGSASIADDGTVYIEAGKLYALYPNNGTVKWTLSVGAAHNSPSLDEDGVIYIGTSAFKFYAIYPNGTIKWTHDFHDEDYTAIWGSSAAISADGTIYFGNIISGLHGGNIIALNPDGTEKWRKRIATLWVDSSPCIGEDGTVYIGSVDEDPGGEDYGVLHAFNDGVPNNPPSAPIIKGPRVGIGGKEYTYTFESTDPDGEDINYYVYWIRDSDWFGPYHSGETMSLDITWDQTLRFIIYAKARDTFGEDSEVSIMNVYIIQNKPFFNTLYFFYEKFIAPKISIKN
jgi:outer membrane protein assembly factor BamB